VRRAGFRGSFWPTPTQEALLRVVLGDDQHVAARWRELQPLDVDCLEPGSFCLLPLLFRRLTDVGLVDEPLLPRLASAYRSIWYRNQLQLERLAYAVGGFQANGTEPVVFGGAALAALWYAQLGLRPITQVDAMVEHGRRESARETLRAAGWRPVDRNRAFDRFVNDDGFVFVLHEGAPPALAGPVAQDVALAALRGDAQRHDLAGASVTTLAPGDELLFVCALGARATMPPTVQWLLDASSLLNALDGPAVARIVERSRAFRIAPALNQTVAYLRGVAETVRVDPILPALAAEHIPRRDLLAHRVAGASAERLGTMPQTLGLYLRMSANDSFLHAITRLPRHLQETWGVTSGRKLPGVVLRKLYSRRRVRGSLSGPAGAPLRRTAGSPSQPPGAESSTERNLSALS
jgi:hypothetical protein